MNGGNFGTFSPLLPSYVPLPTHQLLTPYIPHREIHVADVETTGIGLPLLEDGLTVIQLSLSTGKLVGGWLCVWYDVLSVDVDLRVDMGMRFVGVLYLRPAGIRCIGSLSSIA